MAIRVGIFGYGNLGRGVEQAIRRNPDMELVGVFTRRDPAGLKIKTPGVKVYGEDALVKQEVPMDVLILCGGSATDLPVQGPKYAALYNIIDSFDTHAHIPEHFADVDAAAKKAGKIGIISCGWDPGMFSLNRVYASAVLPGGTPYTFWGKGVSQGHSDAGCYKVSLRVGYPLAQARLLNSPQGRSTQESALSWQQRALIWQGSRMRSRPCLTILMSTIPLYISFPQKKWPGTMPDFLTAEASCIPA